MNQQGVECCVTGVSQCDHVAYIVQKPSRKMKSFYIDFRIQYSKKLRDGYF